MESRKQHIVLKFDTTNVPLTIPAEQEAIYRDSAKRLNDRYHFYQLRNPSKPIGDLWLYVALETAVLLIGDERAKGQAAINKKIQAINELIDSSINK